MLDWPTFIITLSVIMIYIMQTVHYRKELGLLDSAIDSTIRDHNTLLKILIDKGVTSIDEYVGTYSNSPATLKLMLDAQAKLRKKKGKK